MREAREGSVALVWVNKNATYSNKLSQIIPFCLKSKPSLFIESKEESEDSGFELVGVRKEWFKDKSKRVNERIYQLCLRK